MLKRLFDIFCTVFGILLLSPLFIFISLLIKLDDRDQILFKHERIGRYGRTFILYKFRTMKIIVNQETGSFDPGDVSRITRVGRLLRRTKLDELPQLFNVLKGDMSLVGPRPEVKKWIEHYPQKWDHILSVRPGITDNASLLFRDEESILSKSFHPEITYKEEILPKKMELYEEYIKSHTLFGDIALILKTIFPRILKN